MTDPMVQSIREEAEKNLRLRALELAVRCYPQADWVEIVRAAEAFARYIAIGEIPKEGSGTWAP